MLNAQAWVILSTTSFVLAAMTLILVLVLFFHLGIFTIICDLTGITATRQIKKMRLEENSTSRYKYDPNSFRHGKKTENIKITHELINGSNNDAIKEDLSYTDILITDEKNGNINILNELDYQTTVLSQYYNDSTTILSNNFENENFLVEDEKDVQEELRFFVEEEIVVIHTDEKID